MFGLDQLRVVLGLVFLSFLATPLAFATALTSNGNRAVSATFGHYRMKPAGCPSVMAQGRGDSVMKRVLVTGFGPFAGVDSNISGQVVDAMMDPGFWPEKVETTRRDGYGSLSPEHSGKNSVSDDGARVSSRILQIDGEIYQVCFLVLDVKWDLSAAIVVEEMHRFQPEVIVMTGRGADQVLFESGSINQTIRYSGFDVFGEADSANLPLSSWVLSPELPGAQQQVELSWNPSLAWRNARELAKEAGFNSSVAPHARIENNYICNHIAYLVEHAARGVLLRLAGGKLILRPALMHSNVRVGFIHYPANASLRPQDVFTWGRMLARSFAAQF